MQSLANAPNCRAGGFEFEVGNRADHGASRLEDLQLGSAQAMDRGRVEPADGPHLSSRSAALGLL